MSTASDSLQGVLDRSFAGMIKIFQLAAEIIRRHPKLGQTRSRRRIAHLMVHEHGQALDPWSPPIPTRAQYPRDSGARRDSL